MLKYSWCRNHKRVYGLGFNEIQYVDSIDPYDVVYGSLGVDELLEILRNRVAGYRGLDRYGRVVDMTIRLKGYSLAHMVKYSIVWIATNIMRLEGHEIVNPSAYVFEEYREVFKDETPINTYMIDYSKIMRSINEWLRRTIRYLRRVGEIIQKKKKKGT